MIKKSDNDIIGSDGIVRKRGQKNLTKDLNTQKKIYIQIKIEKFNVYL